MSKQAYTKTLLHTDFGTFRAGDVITNGDSNPFNHAIILGFSDATEFGDHFVKLARPYAYATCVGTTSPGVLTGVEEYEVTLGWLRDSEVLTAGGWEQMLTGREHDKHYDDEIIDLRTKTK